MPRRKKEATNEENTTKKTRSKKGKTEEVATAEDASVETVEEAPAVQEEECVIIPIHMIYKGKTYFAGTKVEDEPEEVQEAILLKLLNLLEEDE